MMDLFVSLSAIEKDLKEMEELGSSFAQRLALLDQTVKYIFSKIKDCDTMETADQYFVILDKIQLALAFLVYTEDIGIPERLARFMHDFDNFEEAKVYYFPKIKNGDYVF